MELKVKTELLQSMVAKSMKCASCNKMLPLTNLMAIQLKDNKLTLITTDATNYLYVEEDKVIGDDFYVVVPADVFSKLIARLTCDTVVLSLNKDILSVKGNGNYSIELPLDEDGELVVYPNPLSNNDTFTETGVVNLSTIKIILAAAKPSLAVTNDIPCYTGYYIGDRVVTTDSIKMCGIDVEVFDTPALVYADTIGLLETFDDEVINFSKNEQTIVFSSTGCTLYSNLMDCIDDYKIDIINELLDQDVESHCSVNKAVMLQLLDRLSLFVSSYDRAEIQLIFTRNGLQVQSKTSNSVELIPYNTSEAFKDFTCKVNIEFFKTQVKSVVPENVDIYYGNDSSIKFHNGNITQLVALLE